MAGIKWKITERTYNHLEQDIWVFPDGTIKDEPPDFTDPVWGIAYCFKWLVPKLYELSYYYEILQWNEGQHKAIINKRTIEWATTASDAIDKEVAMAFCLAIEKLIEVK